MEKHPISELMETTMSKIRDMVDVNTIIGQPISTVDGITLIPVSKLSFGFASGGSDFGGKKAETEKNFGGGSGAGVKIDPVAFLIVKDGNVRLINVDAASAGPVDKLLDMAPEMIDKISGMVDKKKKTEEES